MNARKTAERRRQVAAEQELVKQHSEGGGNAPAAVISRVLGNWSIVHNGGGHAELDAFTTERIGSCCGQARIKVEGGVHRCWAFIEGDDGYLRSLLRGEEFATLSEAKAACQSAFDRIEPEPVINWYRESDDILTAEHQGLRAEIHEEDGWQDSDMNYRILIYDRPYTEESADDEPFDCWQGQGDTDDAMVLGRRVLLDHIKHPSRRPRAGANPVEFGYIREEINWQVDTAFTGQPIYTATINGVLAAVVGKGKGIWAASIGKNARTLGGGRCFAEFTTLAAAQQHAIDAIAEEVK